MTKIIAFNLPQFHCIPENDEWWGEGFTEWTNTKKAKPLFKNHNQPREPLNDNYYNLTHYRDIKWQCELAKQYGIYGFCYYHYWFNGKLLLEKPVEILLKNIDIDFPFCFCWANEPWTRAWDGGEKEVLMPQEYGAKDSWLMHYNYLKEFFKDKRYIKIDNKPVFVIYRTSSIEKCDEMIDFFEECCKKDGFNGIYVIEELNIYQNKSFAQKSSSLLEFEPLYTISNRNVYTKAIDKFKRVILKLSGKPSPYFADYSKVWGEIVNRKHSKKDKNIFLGAFVDWDNSARKGDRGVIFNGSSPEKFEKYLSLQLEKAKEIESQFIFINAWNEWAEGTYLEPDKRNGYSYLQALKRAQDQTK